MPDPITIEYKLKEEFKDSEFYRKGYVFTNKRLPKGRDTISTIEVLVREQKLTIIQHFQEAVM
ncbi:hypothetical protein ONA23_06005 [Mycoplasmopsis cynos]|uniref:hypothetical protein n=1 Tax=Mycoplasmopsis cynos TaxID=171284 RepID=UPI0024C9659C|nr:hypothetical protein [Mycoplasmopsis cynos]WAM06490.1 hypothetical protein ONA23_06005 [Mycoplasmopsis cynos]